MRGAVAAQMTAKKMTAHIEIITVPTTQQDSVALMINLSGGHVLLRAAEPC